jgi:hypothetical protein
MSLIVQILILLLSMYLIAKGVEMSLRRAKGHDPNRANNLILGITLLVLGIGAGVGGLLWMMKDAD